MAPQNTYSLNAAQYVEIDPWDEPQFIDMGGGIIAMSYIGQRRILDKATRQDVKQIVWTGRRIVAMRVNNSCEVVQMGPPAALLGDIQYYGDDTWTQDYGLVGDWAYGDDAFSVIGSLTKMSDNTAIVIGANGLDPVFVNGGASQDRAYDAMYELYQMNAWGVRLNRANLTWEVGPRLQIAKHYLTHPTENWYGMAGVYYGDDQGAGIVSMSESIAVASISMYEYGLAGSHYDLDGFGDFTDSGLNFEEAPNYAYSLSDMDVGYVRLVSIRLNSTTLGLTLVDISRASDRMVGAEYFGRVDQPQRISSTRGVLFYPRVEEQGWAAVWTLNANGEFDSIVNTKWMDDAGVFLSVGNPTDDAESVQISLEVHDYYYNNRYDYDNLGPKGYEYPTVAKIADDLFATVGNRGYFYSKFLHILRVNSDGTITILHTQRLHDDTQPLLAYVGEGWLWVGTPDTAPTMPGEPIDGYTVQGSYDWTSLLFMALVHIDLTTGIVDDYVPLGSSYGFGRYRDTAYPIPGNSNNTFFKGRGWVGYDQARALPYGDGHVLLGNANTVAIFSPRKQPFPIVKQAQNPFTYELNGSNANFDLWYVPLELGRGQALPGENWKRSDPMVKKAAY